MGLLLDMLIVVQDSSRWTMNYEASGYLCTGPVPEVVGQ